MLSCELMLQQANVKFSSFIEPPEFPNFTILHNSLEVPLPGSSEAPLMNENSESMDEEIAVTNEDSDDCCEDSVYPISSEEEDETAELLVHVRAAGTESNHDCSEQPIPPQSSYTCPVSGEEEDETAKLLIHEKAAETGSNPDYSQEPIHPQTFSSETIARYPEPMKEHHQLHNLSTKPHEEPLTKLPSTITKEISENSDHDGSDEGIYT